MDILITVILILGVIFGLKSLIEDYQEITKRPIGFHPEQPTERPKRNE